MAKVRIKNVSPQGALIVPVLGNRVVDPGEVIEVDADLAGKPGRGWRKARSNEDPAAFSASRPRDDDGTDVLDLGSGLLAQADSWVPADEQAETPANDAEGGDR